MKTFRPFNINSPKVRLGPDEDGGYVTSLNSLALSNALFTYGVGKDYRYEVDYWNRFNKPVYLFDHRNGFEDDLYLGEGLFFKNQGLGFEENCDDFINHYENLKVSGKVLLKIDIEGGEYDYFERVSIFDLYNFCTGILIEFHFLSKSLYLARACSILQDIYEYFSLVHIHGNNWGGHFDWDGCIFPDVIELSLVNNDLIKDKIPDEKDYPLECLDKPNNPNPEIKDFYISFK